MLKCSNTRLSWTLPDQVLARGKQLALCTNSPASCTYTSSDPNVGSAPGTDGIFTAVATGETTVVSTDQLGNTVSINISVPRSTNIDSDFSTTGRVTIDFGQSEEQANTLKQVNSLILTAGVSGAPGDFALARIHSNGDLDTSFSLDGKVTTDLENAGDDSAADLSLIATNSFLVSGTSNGNAAAIANYDENGNLDQTLKNSIGVNSGIRNEGSNLVISSLLTNGEDTFWLTGNDKVLSNAKDFTIRVFSRDGTPVTSYTQDLGGADACFDSVISSGGKFILVGSSGTQFAVARFDSTGALDNSFGGGDGHFKGNFSGTLTSVANAVALQGDGKIIIGGQYTDTGDGNKFKGAIARIDTDGTLDTSFGTGGVYAVPVESALNDVAILDNGDIAAVGYVVQGGSDQAGLLVLDSSGGTVLSANDVTETATLNERLNAVAIDSIGRLVMAGYSDDAGNKDFLVMRIWP